MSKDNLIINHCFIKEDGFYIIPKKGTYQPITGDAVIVPNEYFSGFDYESCMFVCVSCDGDHVYRFIPSQPLELVKELLYGTILNIHHYAVQNFNK